MSQYTDAHVESNQSKRWPSQDSSESNWDEFSGVVSPVRQSAAYDEPSQVGSRGVEDCYASYKGASPLGNLGPSQSTPRNPYNHDGTYDSESRRVRFSEASGPLLSHKPTCQTTFSDNYYGSQGLRDQTGFAPSESQQMSADLYSTYPNDLSSVNCDRQYQMRSYTEASYTHDSNSFGPVYQPVGQQAFTPSVVSSSAGYQQSYPATTNFQIPQRWSYPQSTPFNSNLRTTRLVRREKEPDKFDGKSVEIPDYLVHFEQVAAWNNWGYDEKGLQLSMCLKGAAQKLLIYPRKS